MTRTIPYMVLLFISTLLFVTCNKDSIPPTGSPTDRPPAAGVWNDFSLTEPAIIDQAGMAMAGYWPDGKISVVPEVNGGRFVLYWGEKYSFRTEGTTTFPEDQIDQVRWDTRVFGSGFNEIADFTDGGGWFIGVHRLKDGRLAGFFHAESAWGNLMAYKSIGVAYSSDNGHTWTSGEKILNVNYQKPNQPRWSGLGDACVVYNEELEYFVCYYSAHTGTDYKICMAVSDDPMGAPGTWKKWDGRNFTVDGYNATTNIGGVDREIAGLTTRAGANPSVMWNDYVQRWIMVYAGWDEVIYKSSSIDGIAWERPVAITNIAEETARYPNLISDQGDLKGNDVVKLYYGRNQNSAGVRQFAYRTILYNEHNSP